MPAPTTSDLHINVPLTNVSIAYKQSASAYIADKVFPTVPVQKRGDVYWKYSKSDWRRTDVQKRAPSTESAGVGWKTTTDNYYADVFAVHKDIDDQLRANADSVFSLDKESTEFITNQMLLHRDKEWASKYFKTGVWATEYTGTTNFVKFSDAGSDPISQFQQWQLKFRQLTGFPCNTVVFGAQVTAALLQHPDIVDRIKYTQRGIVTEDLLATLFKVNKLYTCYATAASGPEMPDAAAQDAAATYDWIINPLDALLLYVPSGPSLMTPSAGYTFTWKGYQGGNSSGIKVSKFRMQHIKSDRIEAEMAYDQKVVCPDLGIFINDAVDSPA